ncbi:MAG TPA: MBL fold metallo-hydrolase [Chitinophagaceae bacterium]|nr:MBL fold metallo-hydrolase [Chitinophagaceae bacterium]
MFNIQTFPFNPVQQNTYVLFNEGGGCIVIDPGCYFDEEKQVLYDFIQNKGLVPKMLLNTHCHLDHVFGNKFISEKYALKLCLHEKEKPVLDYAPTAGLMWNLPFDNYTGDLVYLNEGDKIYLGEDELEIIFTPGHSPGSICFYCKKQHFVVAGDVLFYMSIGRTDLPGGNHQTLLKSIKEQLFVLPDDTVVYPGHGNPTTIGFEKKYNSFLV